MSTTSRRIVWLIWCVAFVLLLAVSVCLGDTPLTPALQARLERRSAKARVVRDALAQAEESRELAFWPPAGYYDHAIAVELRFGLPGAGIVFTTDGSVPTATVGLVYEHPIYLDSRPGVTVLRARQVYEGGRFGPVVSASFVMGVQSRLPVLSLAIDPADLADMETHELARGAEWERPVHLTYITPERETAFALTAGMRIRSQGLYTLPKKSFWLYFRQDYGQGRLDYALFPDQDVRSFNHLVLDAARASSDQSGEALRWTLLESQIVADLTREAGGEAPQGQFVLLFLNGQLWGVYNLRERLDRFFIQDHYNIQDVDLIETRQAQEGDTAHWDALMDFVQNNSLSDAQNYAFIQTQIDLRNLTDYAIIQMYAASDTWPQRNAVRARSRAPEGRWFWLAWDATRGLGATGDPDFNAVEWATRSYALSQHEGGNWLASTLLLRSLLQNDGYRATFVSRAADLLNTALAPESVITHIDRNVDQVAQDIHYEESRWPSPLAWETNIQALTAWAGARPDQMRRELMGKFGLTETVSLEFMPPATGQGYVVVNDWLLQKLPWRGVYFSGSSVRVTAAPAPGYVFAGWSNPDLPSTPSITLTVHAACTLAPRFAPAPANALRPNDAIFNEIWINDNGTRYASLEMRAIEGDWFEILVVRDGLDMRGWRITDNDTKTATDEGSLTLPRTDAFAALPRGTVILVLATETVSNALNWPRDDVDASDGRMILYVGNGTLDTKTDPGFGLGRSNDNLVLLAPGPAALFVDDVGIDFVAEGADITPASFGVLTDGVIFEHPFRRLSTDNGSLFMSNRAPDRASFDNDDGDDPLLQDDQPGAGGWVVDPAQDYTGDSVMPNAINLLTPGQLNVGQAHLYPFTKMWQAFIYGVRSTIGK